MKNQTCINKLKGETTIVTLKTIQLLIIAIMGGLLMQDSIKNDIDVDQLREQLEIDEGVVYAIYKDHLGYETFGIGHLVLESDPECGWNVGEVVSEERVLECFEKDIKNVLDDCQKLHNEWDFYPQEVKQVIANMMFNMGLTRLSKFKKHNAALQSGDWERAAMEGRDSKWYRQVTNRAERLMSRLETI